jgi:PDZ domain-containing secreted protein
MFEDRTVSPSAELIGQVQRHAPGDVVTLTVVRVGEGERAVEVILAEPAGSDRPGLRSAG